jgi:hypothetical protein
MNCRSAAQCAGTPAFDQVAFHEEEDDEDGQGDGGVGRER